MALVLLVEETGVPEENHLSHVTDKFYHIMLYVLSPHLSGVRTHNVRVVIGIDSIGTL